MIGSVSRLRFVPQDVPVSAYKFDCRLPLTQKALRYHFLYLSGCNVSVFRQ